MGSRTGKEERGEVEEGSGWSSATPTGGKGYFSGWEAVFLDRLRLQPAESLGL